MEPTEFKLMKSLVTTINEKGHILAVDDNPVNLQLLVGLLKSEGYKVRPVTRGVIALEAARREPPDLILLDINMPDMDGFAVCEQLKADEALKEIPVIFISALNETTDKVKAFHCGGADYVTKPFRAEEIHARIATHLELHRQKRCLKESLVKLRELEFLRDSLVHMVVHDMNSPIAAVRMIVELLQSEDSKLDAQQTELVGMLASSTRKLVEMVSQVLAVNRLESEAMPLDKTVCEIDQLAQNAVHPLTVGLVNGGRVVKTEIPLGIKVLCDGNIVQRVIGNLVGNALKFTPNNGEVRLTLSSDSGMARFLVTDNGSGIPKEFHQKIFDKFGQVGAQDTKALGTGLGLAFCRLAVEAHGGTIGLESEIGAGSTFWFTLPLAS